MEFSSDVEMKWIAALAQQFYESILPAVPFFVSDEATVLDVSDEGPEELLARILQPRGKSLSLNDLHQLLWKLIRQLNEGRGTDHR